MRRRQVAFGWADVPPPPNMCDFDRDSADEEPTIPRDPDKESGREWWWDLDDWGDE